MFSKPWTFGHFFLDLFCNTDDIETCGCDNSKYCAAQFPHGFDSFWDFAVCMCRQMYVCIVDKLYTVILRSNNSFLFSILWNILTNTALYLACDVKKYVMLIFWGTKCRPTKQCEDSQSCFLEVMQQQLICFLRHPTPRGDTVTCIFISRGLLQIVISIHDGGLPCGLGLPPHRSGCLLPEVPVTRCAVCVTMLLLCFVVSFICFYMV